MKNKPLILVVMSVYNTEKYLKEFIESILNRTYDNFEFIIINDGSIDNSKEKLLPVTLISIIGIIVNGAFNYFFVFVFNYGVARICLGIFLSYVTICSYGYLF